MEANGSAAFTILFLDLSVSLMSIHEFLEKHKRITISHNQALRLTTASTC